MAGFVFATAATPMAAAQNPAAATVTSSGDTITYRGNGNWENLVQVLYDPARAKFLIREDPAYGSSGVAPGPGCVEDGDGYGEGPLQYYEQVACGGPGTRTVIMHLEGGMDAGHIGGDPPARVTILGGAGGDALYGGTGGDTLHGGSDGDNLNGGGGADVLDPGPGARNPYNSDSINGYASDRFDFDQTRAEFEAARLADGGDTIAVSAEFNGSIYGDGGADTIQARGGATVDGGPGADRIRGAALGARSTIKGGGGADRITGVFTRSFVKGGPGNDTLKGNRASYLEGEAGNDTLVGSADADGGPGRDTIKGSGAGDQLFGGKGDDALFGRGGADRLDGSTGDDRALGGAGRDKYKKLFHTGGCAGNDLFVGQAGRDFAFVSCGLVRFRLRDGGPDLVDCRVPAPGAVARILTRDRADRVSGGCGR